MKCHTERKNKVVMRFAIKNQPLPEGIRDDLYQSAQQKANELALLENINPINKAWIKQNLIRLD